MRNRSKSFDTVNQIERSAIKISFFSPWCKL